MVQRIAQVEFTAKSLDRREMGLQLAHHHRNPGGYMASNYDARSGIQVGRVLSQGFGVIVANPVTVLGIVLLFGAIPSTLINWFQQTEITANIANSPTSEVMAGAYAIMFVGWLVAMVLQALVQGALVRVTIAHSEGEKASFGESVSDGLSVALPLIGLAILLAIGVGLGLVLFIIPGIILYVMWAVAAPALVAERTGVFGAFSRSAELTKGARWNVFGVFAILMILTWIVSAAFGIAAGLSAASGAFSTVEGTDPFQSQLSFGWIVGTVVLSVVNQTIWCTVQTSLFVELRNWKDGPSEQALGDIFA
ncbi:hypothetical protein [Stakelama tenebrarum]|uniref:DUF7847 domain-containing protein n=1 Tax=Stakelama tenebrarum TaxID=2711215 RepID=A0A6G6Y6X4_9SPHN|nr:hypothetical protein [Sphingosinithalassobacter tenebrarum]QIG80659.1 hypothetical protein G5C33_13305 [Sphingosinithalassobacter tenebrarum]